MDGWIDGWIDGWMGGLVDGWVDRWTDSTLTLLRYPMTNPSQACGLGGSAAPTRASKAAADELGSLAAPCVRPSVQRTLGG